tara:strand:+ start:8828 stop:9106 length:279 start_codon:yes stop_codon:yes gene_type:complete
MPIRRTVEVQAMHAIRIIRTRDTLGVIITVIKPLHTRTIASKVGSSIGNHAIITTVERSVIETKVPGFTHGTGKVVLILMHHTIVGSVAIAG